MTGSGGLARAETVHARSQQPTSGRTPRTGIAVPRNFADLSQFSLDS